MVEHHEAAEAGDSPGPGPEVVEKKESPKNVRCKESVAGQCRIG